MQTPQPSPREAIDSLVAITQGSPDAHVQAMRAELMRMCRERELNEHTVHKLCTAMDKERLALHNVLPSARKAIESIEAKKKQVETRLAAVEEQLRREQQARRKAEDAHKQGALDQRGASQLESVQQEHARLILDVTDTLERLSRVERSVAVDAATAKFQALQQGLHWIQQTLSCVITQPVERAPESAPTSPAPTEALPEFVKELQTELQQVTERAQSYQDQLQASKAQVLRLELENQQQLLELQEYSSIKLSVASEDIPDQTLEEPGETLSETFIPDQTLEEPGETLSDLVQQSKQPPPIVPRLRIGSPSFDVIEPESQFERRGSSSSIGSFDVDSRVKELLDGYGSASPGSIASDSSLLRDVDAFTGQLDFTRTESRRAPNSVPDFEL